MFRRFVWGLLRVSEPFVSGWYKRKAYGFAECRNNDTSTSHSWKWHTRTGNRYKDRIRPYPKSKERLNVILAKNTGKSVEEIALATERDHYMSAMEAVDFGLIDKIIVR